MHAYPRRLHNRTMEHISAAKHPDAAEYHRCIAAQNKAWTALAGTLSSVQPELAEDCQSTRSNVSALEDGLLAAALAKQPVQS